jgi:holin-like protein
MILRVLALLLFCQLCGEVVVRGVGLPLPGPVLGLCLLALLLALAARSGRWSRENIDDHPIGRVSAGLLSVMGLLFVPAGVGLLDYIPLFATHGAALFVALLGSTILTLLVTVGVFRLVARRLPREEP